MINSKRILKIIALFFLSIIVCMGIGQKLIAPIIEPKNDSEQNKIEFEQNKIATEESDFSLVNSFDFFALSGNAQTLDNPWKTTIGKIEVEGEGTCIFMTPDTGMEIPSDLLEFDKYIFYAKLHPWVSESSDGAEINIQLCNENGEIIEQSCVEITKEDDFKPVVIDMGADQKQITSLKIVAGNGKNNNSLCDWIIIKDTDAKQKESKEQFFISAHYFADEWPINFWNSEMDNLKNDLIKIKNDGFNSIILVIPWREFQPAINPVTYNTYAFEQLNRILKEAEIAGLGVLVRVGYTWDYYEDSSTSSLQRFNDLPGNTELRIAWNLYLDTLYKELNKYENFWGGFITWEDFWNNTYLADTVGGSEKSISLPICNEFQNYVEKQYTLDAFNKLYGTEFNKYQDIYIPSRKEAFMEVYYAFYDDWLMNLLNESQNFFPELSMEVRNDWDSYYNKRGEHTYYKHDVTYTCQNAKYSTLMYGIPQGCQNNGEFLGWEEAIEKTKYIIHSFNELNPTKPVFIDQLIFTDNTPGFEKNAKIKEDEIRIYLENIDTVLKEDTCGIGIWTYRDYANNLLYNPQFALEDTGWSIKNAVVKKDLDSNCLIISPGGEANQKIPFSRKQFKENNFILELDAVFQDESEEYAILEITVGEITKIICLNSNESRYNLSFDNPATYDLTIKSNVEVAIDNVNLYNHILSGYLYDKSGNELDLLIYMKKLNYKLKNN